METDRDNDPRWVKDTAGAWTYVGDDAAMQLKNGVYWVRYTNLPEGEPFLALWEADRWHLFGSSKAKASGIVVVDGPVTWPHYGGEAHPYEAIKVIESWLSGSDLSPENGFCIGNVLEYISRAGSKNDILTDLRKARWYLDRAIGNLSSN